jgi:hypothetical protein
MRLAVPLAAIHGFLLPLALLLAYAAAFGIAAFGASVPGFDDHPGQLYRLWHALERGAAPWTWNGGWFAGYPELQFYPPGFFYAGLALRWLSGHALAVTAVYQVLLWLAWVAPGAAVFALLARRSGSGWAALPGALAALTLSGGTASGVEGAVHVGMLPARLALALLPLLALALAAWLGGRARAVWAAVPVLAAIALTHPTHVPGAVALGALAATLAGDRPAGGRAALAALGLAAACTGFWSLPMLARLEHARALAWGSLSVTAGTGAFALGLAALAALAWPLARGPADRMLAGWPWAMVAVVAADALLLERAGLRWLPADRVADAAWLAGVIAAGLAVARLAVALSRRLAVPVAALARLGVGAAAAGGLATGALTLWPRGPFWPSLAAVERGVRLDALWSALATGEGRVLFTRSSVPLVFGTEWWRPHSHATGLAPLRAGRPIVHGTFTHPSPVAALVYRGTPGPAAIDTLAERLDGERLFGRPLEGLDDAALEGMVDRLGIGAVVVLDEDLALLRALGDGRLFPRRTAAGPFTVFARDTVPALPVEVGPGRWRLDVDGAPAGWIPARVTYYPLWRAERGGVAVPTRRGAAWDLEVELRPGAGPLELTYTAGGWEHAGLALSALGVVGWLVALGRRRRR